MTNDIEDDADDVPHLSAETLKILQEFLEEQTYQEKNCISENWQLSQFWYDDNTTLVLSSAVFKMCKSNCNIALLSCPTLYPTIKSKTEGSKDFIKIVLFEFDKRFAKYDPDFEYYDYNEPLNICSKYSNFFDVIVVDPPFLSEECLTKIVNTIDLIKKSNSRIILCTGAVLEELGEKLLNVKRCSFKPKHKNNLRNEFICMTNFGEVLKDKLNV